MSHDLVKKHIQTWSY